MTRNAIFATIEASAPVAFTLATSTNCIVGTDNEASKHVAAATISTTPVGVVE
jgi:hypothetical protein